MCEGLKLEEVPVVDLSGAQDDIIRAIRLATQQFGFMYVENHGVSPELLHQQSEQFKAFFNLPAQEKNKLAKAGDPWRGYTATGVQTLHPETQSQPDTKEALKFASQPSSISFQDNNVWPPEELLPGFRDTITRYFKDTSAVGLRLMKLIAVAMDLDEHFFQPFFTDPILVLRGHYYAPVRSDPSQGVFAAGQHTDWGALTLLAVDGEAGLEVELEGRWLPVPPRSNAFIVNVGDLLQRWSNDVLRSALHRVVTTGERPRHSTALFLEPNANALVQCLPSCCSQERPARYPAVLTSDYLRAKYELHGN
eukprot:jgi/Botrbrau1/4580/Bobra.60_2s0066.1